MSINATYSGEREVRTFADLNHGSDVLLRLAQESARGSYYTLMSALLLKAFTFEAYLNHLGDKTFAFWQNVDSIRVVDKYSVLCSHLGISLDKGNRPFQTLIGLFKFRNSIAHGKSVVLREEKSVNAETDPYLHTPKTDWEEYVTIDNAIRAKEDVSALIAQMHKAAGLGDYPFIHGSTVSEIRVTP